jgi:hypothetical protein
MNWEAITKNWKTTLAGILTFLLGAPAFVSALQAWGAHQPVDWRAVLVSVALTAGAAGLLSAKDSSTHSTVAEVSKATAQADVQEIKKEEKMIQSDIGKNI